MYFEIGLPTAGKMWKKLKVLYYEIHGNVKRGQK